MESTKRVAKNIVYNVSSLFVGSFSGLLLTVILARILNPDLFGIYCLSISIANLAISFATLGIDNATIRYIAYYAGQGDFARIRGYFRYFLKIKASLALIVSLILFISSKKLSEVFGDERLYIPFLFSSLIVLVAPFPHLLSCFFKGLQKFKYSFLRQFIYEISRLIFVIPLTALFLVTGAILGTTLAYLTSLIFLIWIVLTKYRHYVFGEIEKIDKKVNMFIGFMTIASVTGIIYSYIDTIMIGYFLTPEYVGYYKAAYTIIFAIIGVLSSVSDVMFPLFTQLNFDDIKIKLRQLIRYSSILGFPFVFLLMFLSKEIIITVYGARYITAASVMFVLSFIIIPGIYNYLYQILNAKERADITAMLVIIGTTLNIILNYILIRSMGVVGAAIATVICRYFIFILACILLYKLFNIIPNFKPAVKPFISSLIMIGILSILPRPETLEFGIFEIIFAGSIYLFILFLLKELSKDDLIFIKNLIKEQLF